ncbi:TIGR00730 family Rossman fold protein [Halioxenophilus sp. WMMB6]|uniref:LOG family protein n=1 Tax=Halioxenophilus sp. WMMB6 TaxID=3073815 RepID=UPI00398BDD8A
MGKSAVYANMATELARQLAAREIELVYGGASVGTMGALADAMLSAGGRVIGVIPNAILDREIAHEGLSELIIVKDMHERKATMADLADAFIALPGGLGTLEELFEMLTWLQLGIHQKPCGLLNVGGFYDHLEQFLHHARDEGFVRSENIQSLLVDTAPGALVDRLLAVANGDA